MSPPFARAMTRARVVGALVGGGLVLLPVLVTRPVTDPSPWLHLKVGAFLLDGGSFGLPDPWAPLASHAFVPTQWIPSVVSARLYPDLGAPLVAWERAGGITLLALALLLWAVSLTRTWVAVAATAVVVFAAWPSLTERPQLAGFVLLVPVLAAWWRTGSDLRVRWYLIPLTWVAAATHGVWSTGVAVGGLVAGLLIVSGRVTRRTGLQLVALVAGCVGAAALTPVGPRLLLTPFAVSAQGRQFVQEWMPSSVRSPHVLAALALLAVAWLCWTALGSRPPAWQLALLLASCAMALAMERTVAVAALVALPLVCTSVERVLGHRRAAAPEPADHAVGRPTRLLWIAAAAVGLALAVPVAAARAAEPHGVPLALAPRLTALPAGTHILVDSDTSGWVMFAAPQLAPVYDLRVESYSPTQVEDYIAVMAADPGWESYITDHRVTVALVPVDAPIRAALTEQYHWTDVAHDHGLVLLEAPR